MKRMWQNWLAIVTLVAMAGTASAQNGWNQPSEIGSYQSILSRAGYGSAMGSPGQAAMQPGVPMQGSALQGGAMVQGAYGMAGSTGAPIQGGAISAAPVFAAPPAVGQVQGGAIGSGSRGAISSGAIGSGGVVGGSGTRGAIGSGAFSSGAISSGAIGSGAISSGAIGSGGVVSGSGTRGAIGSGVMSAPLSTGQIMSAPMASAPVITSAPVLTSQVDLGSTFVSERPLYGNSVVSAAPAYQAPVYSSPVYQQSVVAPVYTGGGGQARRQRSNYTVGITGLFFQRDYEDNRLLARNPSGGTLSTNDADDGSFDGYGINFGSRNARGGGFEVAYWAFNPGRSIGVLQGANVATTIRGLDQLLHVSSGRDLLDIYSNTVTQTIVRETDINNLEFNLLRNGGTFCGRKNRRGFLSLIHISEPTRPY